MRGRSFTVRGDRLMSKNRANETDRRSFLQAGAVAAGVALTASPGAGAQEVPAKVEGLPTRKLGKTGVDVTIVDQGTLFVAGLDRLLRLGYERGIRVFDTAAAYRTE